MLICVRFFVTPWTVACQGCLSTGFSRQEYWNGLPFPSPGDLPNWGIKPKPPECPAWADRFFATAGILVSCECWRSECMLKSRKEERKKGRNKDALRRRSKWQGRKSTVVMFSAVHREEVCLVGQEREKGGDFSKTQPFWSPGPLLPSKAYT